jgi:hypothetical protein
MLRTGRSESAALPPSNAGIVPSPVLRRIEVIAEPLRKRSTIVPGSRVWLLFFALLVPAGFVGYVIGQSTSHHQTRHGGPGPKAALISHATRTTSASR